MQEETEAFTLEQRFSSALSYLCDSSERGFQARLAGRIGVLVAGRLYPFLNHSLFRFSIHHVAVLTVLYRAGTLSAGVLAKYSLRISSAHARCFGVPCRTGNPSRAACAEVSSALASALATCSRRASSLRVHQSATTVRSSSSNDGPGTTPSSGRRLSAV